MTQIRSSGRLVCVAAATSLVTRRCPWHFFAGCNRLMLACVSAWEWFLATVCGVAVPLRCRIVLSDFLVVLGCAVFWTIPLSEGTLGEARLFLRRFAFRLSSGFSFRRAPRKALSRFPTLALAWP
jgi:hypothetical protein